LEQVLELRWVNLFVLGGYQKRGDAENMELRFFYLL
jgi:hypothetical protein